jgi:VWFA-related protein
MRYSRLLALAVLFTALLPATSLRVSRAAGPASQASRPPEPQQTVVRVTTRLVQVSVVVHDRKGEPVTDLTRDDFTLLEDGQPQAISVFTVEISQPAAASLVRTSLPTNTFSNKLQYGAGAATSLTAVLLDGLNTKFEDQSQARQQIMKFLKQIRPGDQVALYALGRDLRLLHDFTNDSGALLRALNSHKGNIATELAASEEVTDTSFLSDSPEDQELAQFIADMDETMQAFYVRNRKQTTLEAIEAIANNLSRLPGRKNLVWVSGSFPLTFGLNDEKISREFENFSNDVQRTTRAVTSANVAIYPVDARGLIGGFDMYPDLSPAAPARKNIRTQPMQSNASKIWDTFGSMDQLAEGTGGRAFRNTNDINGAIRKAIDDARATYVLGYYPKHGAWDGKYHEIKVQVRQRGLQVRHRRGYYAYADPPHDDKLREAELRVAAWSSLESTGMDMTVRLDPPPPTAFARPYSLQIRLGPQDVQLQEKNNRWEGLVDVLFVFEGAEDKQLGALRQAVNVSFPPPNYQLAARYGMVMFGQIDLPAGTRKLRVIARDVAAGRVGSVTIPLDRLLTRF